jgi:iron(III) transport system substrate-binding protein
MSDSSSSPWRISRRAFLEALVIGGNAAALAACQSSASVSGGRPGEPAVPAPVATNPPSAGAGSGSGAWEKEWTELVQAARQEGRLAVVGPPTPAVRTELPAAFKSRFGIDIEYLGGNTAELMSRMEAERQSGQYSVDAILGGSQTLYTRAYPQKFLDPIPPALVHPEAKDGSRWTSGRLWFMDPEDQFILRISNQVGTGITVNTDYVQPGEIRSWHDLLLPKYRGKISAYDPTVAGQGWPTAMYMLHLFGEDYTRTVYTDQQPGLTRDYRQLADWMARGVYPISLGVGNKDLADFRADGFPIVRLQDFPEAPSTISAGFGLTVLINQAPHPSAARLFVNWMAMKEGQEVFNRAEGNVSPRTDVDNAWAPAESIPQPGMTYFDSYGWEYTLSEFTPEKLAKMRQLTGRT